MNAKFLVKFKCHGFSIIASKLIEMLAKTHTFDKRNTHKTVK